jgi:membrane-associated protease RseP (regulator of RpoE activity)
VSEPIAELPFPATFTPWRKFQDRRWKHVVLFILTLVSTTLVGAEHYRWFLSDSGRVTVVMSDSQYYLSGLWYSGTVLLILGAHELGHYLACRYYQVDASLPFFIPMPILLTGTLGAFIRIREPIPTKRMLFDIGSAGPFAGFVFAVPALFIGLLMSRVVLMPDPARLPPNVQLLALGEPLLLRAAAWSIWGTLPAGYTLDWHPTAFAAWFGLIATSFNLFPIGQLDGGHISYAVLGRRSTAVTLGAICVAVILTFFSLSLLMWTCVLIAMTLIMGPRHPRTIDEDVPLDRTRLWLAFAAMLIFIICFSHNPIEPAELLGR